MDDVAKMMDLKEMHDILDKLDSKNLALISAGVQILKARQDMEQKEVSDNDD